MKITDIECFVLLVPDYRVDIVKFQNLFQDFLVQYGPLAKQVNSRFRVDIGGQFHSFL